MHRSLRFPKRESVVAALLSVALFSFAAVDVRYLSSIFTDTSRWTVLLIYVGVLLFSVRRADVAFLFASAPSFWLVPLVGLILLSPLWSIVPMLSLAKGYAYLVVAISFLLGGVWCARRISSEMVLKIFYPLVALALLAGLGGTDDPRSVLQANDVVSLYRGLTSNPNYLGLITICCLPAVMQATFTLRVKFDRRSVLAMSSYLVLVGMLISTYSRASILAAAALHLVYAVSCGSKTLARALVAAALGSWIAASILPQAVADLELRYVYKGAADNEELFYSREEAWDESLTAARDAGLWGIGFGASSGYTDFVLGANTANYGREKGNGTLAQIEEIGILGACLFWGLVTSVLWKALRAGSKEPRRSMNRAALAAAGGGIFALLVNAQFEAWILSPGAAATPVFWTLVGLTISLSAKHQRDRRGKISAVRKTAVAVNAKGFS